MKAKEDQILENQKVLAKALLFLVWKQFPITPGESTSKMRKQLAKLAGEP